MKTTDFFKVTEGGTERSRDFLLNKIDLAIKYNGITMIFDG